MSLTRTQLRLETMRAADAVLADGTSFSPRWNTTAGTGEVDRILSFIFDKEWRGILNAEPFFRMIKRTPTTNSSGRVAIASLTTTVADDEKRLYRILHINDGSARWDKVDFTDVPMGEDLDFQEKVWYREGSDLFFLPKEASKQYNVYINYIPTRPKDLSGDGVNVDFPDGYEDLLIWESAARILAKGGAETNVSLEFKAFAQEMRADLLQSVGRLSIDPTKMKYGDDAESWGAQ